MDRILRIIDERTPLILWGTIGLLTIWAFAQRFPMDDAYISFRYARHLSEGLGLVWNVGEPIEGYSNFLWTILCALGMKIGVAPEKFTLIINLPIYVATFFVIYRIGIVLGLSRAMAISTVVLTGFTRSIYAFPTSGLETSLQILQFLLLTYFLILSAREVWTTSSALRISILLALMALTRPDAAVPGFAAIFLFWERRREHGAREWSAFLLPAGLVILVYFGWKLSFYGSIIPNSFHAKVRDVYGLLFGLFYLNQFLLSHLLYPFFFFVGWLAGGLKRATPGMREALILMGSWTIYVVSVGGDFMEYRFWAPVIPLFYITILKAISQLSARRAKTALAAGLAAGVLHGNFAMEHLVFGYGIESVAHIRGHLTEPDENWILIGKKLKEYLGGTDAVISVGAAGAIPYFSELKTIDFMGLNDLTIPNSGERFANTAGHRIISTVDYLKSRGVNLIIEPNNYMLTRQEYVGWSMGVGWKDLYRFYLDPDKPVAGKEMIYTMLLGIPMDKEHYLVAWYLTPSPTIENAIAKYGWTRFEITRW